MAADERLANSHRTCRVAVVQHPPVYLNLERSIERACELVAEAAGQGAGLVVFPESWLPGYPVWLDEAPGAGLWGNYPAQALYQVLVENALTLPGQHLERLRAAARRAQLYLVMGAHERQGGTLYNTMLLIDPTGAYRIHRKLTPTYTERMVWGQGDGSTLNVMETPYGPVGGLICWEHWMPLARAAMHAEGERIHVAQWPAVNELHQLASRHYAFEGQCFVLAAGTVLSRRDVIDGFNTLPNADPAAGNLLETIPGEPERLLKQGGSAVIAPDSEYVAGPIFDEPCILHAEIDLDQITRGHLLLDTSGHYARPDIFHLAVNTAPQRGVTFNQEGE